MKRAFVLLLLIIASIVWCHIYYQPISGELLEHWNSGYLYNYPIVYHFDSCNLPNGIYELHIVGIEVERDSLNIYLMGTAVDTDIPFLLATGGYRGDYNFAKSNASYDEEENQICLYFEMPFSARYCKGCYRWDIEDESLELLQYINGDPSLDAMERADSLMAGGDIAEAIDELNNIFYPCDYYDPAEMIVRLLRIINRAAGEVSTGPVEGMEIAYIPSGHFLMGTPSSEEGCKNEGPQHRVGITAFELMTTEVTQSMWRELMGESYLEHNMTRGEGDHLCRVNSVRY